MTIIDHVHIAQQLATGDAGNSHQKGQALENVVADTFCLLEGVGIIERNIVNVAGSLEIDILLYNHRSIGALPFLPDLIVVECKNWEQPVDSATLTVFTGKLDKFRVDVGILVAANGITGNPLEVTAAHAHIQSTFDRRGIKIIVLTRQDIESLRSTEELSALVRKKYGRCIMGVAQF